MVEKNPDLPSPQRLQLNTLTEACVRGIERCHLLDGRVEGALLAELLTPKGAGVMITNSSYKRTRPARFNDVQSILEILSSLFSMLQLSCAQLLTLSSKSIIIWFFVWTKMWWDVAKLLVSRTVPLQKLPVWQLINCIGIRGSAVN